METNSNTSRSRILAYILRHDKKSPLGPAGWLHVDYLISHGGFSIEEIVNIVSCDGKMRFELNDCMTQIRALYGHSVPVDLGLECKMPPPVLYHGTSADVLSGILEEGLIPMSRNFVHLSDDRRLAIETGQRHGDPVLACVNTSEMTDAGFSFYNPTGHIWLVSGVPARYINFEYSCKSHFL